MTSNFLPNFRYIFSNPFFITRRYLYLQIKDKSKHFKAGALLDIGCGTKPYQVLFEVEKYIGMDYSKEGANQNSNADIVYEGKQFPIKDESFEYALATEVLEHVFEPENFIKEIHRVLKEGGLLLVTVPFVWDEHEQPYDFGRYTSFGLRHLFEKNGFEVVEQHKTGNFITTIGQMTATYFFYIFSKNRYLYTLSLPFFFAPLQIVTLIFSKLLPLNNGFYLDNIILLRKKTLS